MQSVVSKLNENFRQPVRQTSVIEGEKLALLIKACDRFVLCQLISDWEESQFLLVTPVSSVAQAMVGCHIHPSGVGKLAGDACGFRQNLYTVF